MEELAALVVPALALERGVVSDSDSVQDIHVPVHREEASVGLLRRER
jgi:hypothetical protein